MRSPILAFAVLVSAGAAHAQSPQTQPPASSGSDLTRDLNSRPPTIEEYLARPTPAPAPSASDPLSTAGAAPTPGGAPAASAPAPTGAPGRSAAPVPAPPPARSTAGATAAAPPAPAAEATRLRTPAPAAGPAPASAPPPAAPPSATAPGSAPRLTVLDAAARAALPFSVELPQGFEIVAIPSPPQSAIYRVRRGERTFVMIYAGPASQFPIYSGELVEAGGRTSVVVAQEGGRHAVEHLFQQASEPREIHAWTMSLEGSDRTAAERIAQSVDLR